MLPLRQFLLLLLVVTGCAAAQKTPFEEAFGAPPASPVPTAPPLAIASAELSSAELHAALFSFSGRVEAGRVGVKRGERMAAASVTAWHLVLAQVDRLLARQAEKTSPFDLARARVVLQSELAADAHLYGDIPATVADGAQRSVSVLSARLAQLAPARLADLRRFIWPVAPVVVTSPYGTRVHPITGDYRFHPGMDLLAERAQPVHAAYDGVVVYSGWHGAYGKAIDLQHDPHLSTRYGHLLDVLVCDGAKVRRGEVIGLAGSTGLSTGVHLHFELLKDGRPEDPEFGMPSPDAVPHLPAIAQNGTSPGFPQSSSDLPHFISATEWP